MNPISGLLRAVALVASTLPLFAATGGGGPFESSLRWTYGPGAAPWIPSTVRFAAHDGLVWASGNYGTPHLALLSVAGRPSDGPLFVDGSVAAAFPILAVEAGRRPNSFFSLAQYPAPDAWHRRTEVVAHGLTSNGGTSGLGATWSHDLGWIVNGSARFGSDAQGDLLVAAVRDAVSGLVRVDWLRASDGTLLARRDLAAASLEAVEVSPDGRRVAIAAGVDLWVFDAGGQQLHHEILPAGVRVVALSESGTAIALGEPQRLRLLREVGSTYQTVAAIVGAPSEIAVCAALSHDASTYAVAWWDAATGVDFRLEVRDGTSHQVLRQVVQSGTAGGLQNLPAALAISPDGRRIALGVWGDGGPAPELWLLDRDRVAPVLEVDLPGSVQDLDLDATGTRLVVAMKHTHANQVGSTGEVRLYDTGERELQLVGQPRLGGSLDLAFRNPAAEGIAVFLLGFRAPQPVSVPGALGDLLLDRGQRMWPHYVPVDANGRADLSLPLPADPNLFGLPLTVQVAWRGADGTLVLSPTAVDPTLL